MSLPPRILEVLARHLVSNEVEPNWEAVLKSHASQSNLSWQVVNKKNPELCFFVKEYRSKLLFERSLTRTLHLDYFVAEQGLGPQVIFVSKSAAVIGYEYLETSLLAYSDQRAHHIQVLAYALAQIHQLKPRLPSLPLQTQLENYCRILDKQNSKLAQVFRADIQSYLPILDKSAQEDQVFCHNDLSFDHIFIEQKKIKVIDWEYAGYMHFGFDLAMALVMNDLHEEEIDAFLKAYNSYSPLREIEREEMVDWMRLVAFVNHLWFKIQETAP